MFEALWQAAERGVRVRLLLDDNEHRAASTRRSRRWTPIGTSRCACTTRSCSAARGCSDFLTDFARLNRRMHNKSFTVDNQVTVVGGRNIGNEYFGGRQRPGLRRPRRGRRGAGRARSVEAVRPLLEQRVRLPGGGLRRAGRDRRRRATDRPVRARRARTRSRSSTSRPFAQRRSCTTSSRGGWPSNGRRPGSCTMIRPRHWTPKVASICCSSRNSCGCSAVRRSRSTSISPYFVPGDDGTAALAALAGRGVKVRILTNSLAASDVAAVHAGYAKRRHDLLKAGVQLFELKPTAAQESRDDKHGLRVRFILGVARKDVRRRWLARVRRFVQLRPAIRTPEHRDGPADRAARRWPERSSESFDTTIPQVAYEVRLASDGDGLEWIERSPAERSGTPPNPARPRWRRLGVGAMSLLPIEWLL